MGKLGKIRHSAGKNEEFIMMRPQKLIKVTILLHLGNLNK